MGGNTFLFQEGNIPGGTQISGISLILTPRKAKKEPYNARIIQIEKGSFTPLIFSCTGGAGPKAEGTS